MQRLEQEMTLNILMVLTGGQRHDLFQVNKIRNHFGFVVEICATFLSRQFPSFDRNRPLIHRTHSENRYKITKKCWCFVAQEKVKSPTKIFEKKTKLVIAKRQIEKIPYG